MTDHTQFDYLLNAFEQASQSDKPADLDYAGKRKALYAYVRGLEGKDQQAAEQLECNEMDAFNKWAFNDAPKDMHAISAMFGWMARSRHAQQAVESEPAHAEPEDEWMVNLAIVAHCSNPTVEAAAKLIMDWYQGAEPDRAEAVESERDKVLEEAAQMADYEYHMDKEYDAADRAVIENVNVALSNCARAIRELKSLPAQADKPRDCSNDPSSCPDNEGRGCYCTDNKLLPCPGAQADKELP